MKNYFVIYRRRSLNTVKIAKCMRLPRSANSDGETRNAHRILVETIFEHIHLKSEKNNNIDRKEMGYREEK
jgi:hypothetical protein